MTDIAHLESIAQQLAARVRDEPREDVARWLQAVLPDPGDWFRLCFVFAVAHPEDRGWKELTAWVDRRAGLAPQVYRPSTPEQQELRRRALGQELDPKRRAA